MSTAEISAERAGTAEETQLVVFLLGREEYALPIDSVKEVVQYSKPRPVSSSDPGLTGVINLRGRITPVYELAERLGLTPTGAEGRKIVVLEGDGVSSGLIVDDVAQVVTLHNDQLQQHASADPNLINAIAKLEDHLVVLLNPDAFVLQN